MRTIELGNLGPWTVVQKPNRRINKGLGRHGNHEVVKGTDESKVRGTTNHHFHRKGSRFTILNEERSKGNNEEVPLKYVDARDVEKLDKEMIESSIMGQLKGITTEQMVEVTKRSRKQKCQKGSSQSMILIALHGIKKEKSKKKQTNTHSGGWRNIE